MKSCFLTLLMLIAASAFAAKEGREVAITIDDLPRGGDGGRYDLAGMSAMTKKLLLPFREQKIPVIGFVNTGRVKIDPQGLRSILDLWLDAGAELGNHSYSHLDINNIPLDEYTADILRGEAPIRVALAARGKKLEFYRHPYLHTGPTSEIKQGLQDFLDQHGYRVAPVTLDDADYAFAAAYLQPGLQARVRREYVPYMESIVAFFERRSVEVVGREIPQILLIHASQMNADLMPELLGMYRKRGYRFVTLAHALEDPVYRLPDEYVGRGGFSWFHRWSKTKGMVAKGEPEAPEWVMKAFEASRRAVVRQIDHILITSSEGKELFSLLKDTFQFPVAWPMSDYGGFASGGVAVGNVNLEIIKNEKSVTDAVKSRWAGFALEPEPLRISLAELDSRGIRHGQPAVFRNWWFKTRWTTVGLPDVSSDTFQVFFCEYAHDRLEQRRLLLEQLRLREGGSLSVHSVKEIVYGASNVKRMQAQWQKLLNPLQLSSQGVWRVGAGPALRVIQADKDGFQGLVINVKSLSKARLFLKERGLLGAEQPTEITLSGSLLQGLNITLVEQP